MPSTHMSPGKRKGCTAKARYAMSMKRTPGRAAIASAWTPWVVPWGFLGAAPGYPTARA